MEDFEHNKIEINCEPNKGIHGCQFGFDNINIDIKNTSHSVLRNLSKLFKKEHEEIKYQDNGLAYQAYQNLLVKLINDIDKLKKDK